MAIHTHLSCAQAQEFLARYRLGELTALHGIHEGIENTNYHLITSQGRYILTLYEGRTSLDDIPFFHALTAHLKKQGLPCPSAIKDKKGNNINELAGKPASIVEFLTGQSPAKITPHHCHQVGQNLAHLHKASNNFHLSRHNDLNLKAWQHAIITLKDKSNQLQKGLHDTLMECVSRLARTWDETLPCGIIHGDLFPDNVFFNNSQLVGIIDFYFACTDSFLYDFAITLNAWCFDDTHKKLDKSLCRSLWQGYEEQRSFTAQEKEAFVMVAQGASLRFLLTRLEDWQEGQTIKDPRDYITRLEYHLAAQDLDSYGVTA